MPRLPVLILCASFASLACAEPTYPTKPVRIVVPSSAAAQAQPRAIVNQITPDIGRALDMPEVRERYQAVDFHVVKSTPEEFDRMTRADIQTFAKVAKAAGLIAK